MSNYGEEILLTMPFPYGRAQYNQSAEIQQCRTVLETWG